MKATETRQFAPLISLLLKVIGSILLLSFFLDAIILISPSLILERSWQINYVTQIVDRGVVPMVGLAFFLVSLWMDQTSGFGLRGFPKLLSFFAFLLSSLMALVFLLMIPFHINNVLIEKDATVKRITQEAAAAESQIDVQIQQQQSQIASLLGNPQQLEQLDKLIKSGQIQGEQLAQLQRQQEELLKFKDNPTNLKKQAEEAKNRGLTSIRERKLNLEKQAASTALRSSIRTGFSSFLLALGYAAIGWTGLKSLDPGGGRKSR